MNKKDYKINCADSLAAKSAPSYWDSARKRRLSTHLVWDLRNDDRALSLVPKASLEKNLEQALLAASEEAKWEDILETSNYEVNTFTGFVYRITQQKDNSYWIEAKTIQDEVYEEDTGWLMLAGLRPLAPDAKRIYRYAYQPYIPGSVVAVKYLTLPPWAIDGYPRPPYILRLCIEDNEYSRAYYDDLLRRT